MKSLSEIKGMRNIPTSIVRKISGMPRTRNSRKDYLQIYVLAKEKDRMEQELEMLEGKRDNLLKNLTFIESKMAEYQEFVNNSMNVQCILSSTTVSTSQTDATSQTQVNISQSQTEASQSQTDVSQKQVNISPYQEGDFHPQAETHNKIKSDYKENDVITLINQTVKGKKEGADFAKPSLFIRFDEKR
jgi:hypothetical protein